MRYKNLNTAKYIIAAILILLSVLFYFMFITTWFSYFTDALEYKNSGWSSLSKITNGSLK